MTNTNVVDSRSQSEIDGANAAFWNSLCGSHLASVLGITDDGPESLKRFDDWFFDFYPYLTTHVPVAEFAGKKVLEVGLGYGSLSQKIAEGGADYLGMDIALGPVAMVQHRLKQQGLPGDAVQRSFLANGLPDNTFDAVTAIGCFHHTGDVQGCFNETFRILKPGGTAHLMVYNRYSHRRWMTQRKTFLREMFLERLGLLQTARARSEERAANDQNEDGEGAPETVFLSAGEVKRRMRRFSKVRVFKENMDESMDPKWKRERVMYSYGRRMGLDLYIVATK
jgi:2-polyprenyl-3-methyl-5-hydroxy-6-metoxy-1,4-benzoquinol methylase